MTLEPLLKLSLCPPQATAAPQFPLHVQEYLKGLRPYSAGVGGSACISISKGLCTVWEGRYKATWKSGIQTPMAQGRSTTIISMIQRTGNSRLSMNISLSVYRLECTSPLSGTHRPQGFVVMPPDSGDAYSGGGSRGRGGAADGL